MNTRPIDQRGSNPGRALGGLLMGLLVILWAAVFCALVWIASVPA